MPSRLLTLPAVLVLALSVTACGDEVSSAAGSGTSDDGETSASGETTECTYESAGQAARDVDAPPNEAPAEGEVAVTLATSVGDLDLALDRTNAPCTVNSFVSLAEQDYFDDTECHRLTTQGIFVLQCGDPTASGTGGPGYTFPDEVSPDATYPAGTLAMANAGPDTNGSQFFMVYDDTELSPDYTVFGRVGDAALAKLRKVARAGTTTGTSDGPPKTPVTIKDATVG